MKNINNQKFIEYTGLKHFNYAVNISLLHKYVYVETPKVACSTIKITLQRMELDNDKLFREDPNDIHNRNLSPLLRPSQIDDFSRLVQSDDFFKFCFVRNPYHRLLSVYLEKICGNKFQKKEILAQLNYDIENLKQEISFEKFVKAVVEQPIFLMNPHWKGQYYQTLQNHVKYDFVGKLENFDNDFVCALEKMGVQNYNKYLSEEKRHASNASEKIKRYYTTELRDLVYTKYKKDFEYFKYSSVLSEISSEEAAEVVVAILDKREKDRINKALHHDADNINKCKLIQQRNDQTQRIRKSKSFLLGDLFFRSVKRPYKLLTYPYNFIKILLK